MKRIGGLLLVSIFAGAITLGAYKLFFERPNYAIVTSDEAQPVFSTSYTPTSALGSGINEVDFTNAAERTVNSVVHVKNLTLSTRRSSVFDFFYGSGGTVTPQVGTGSGVIISQDGYIVTNNHVIANATQLQVTLNNNQTYEAELVGTDPNSDIALIKIETDDKLPYLAFGDSDNTKIGEWVLAVGNPFNLTSTVTAGIVSAKARSLDTRSNQSFIQTDAAVNPGNSGGALVNTNGDLIGINTAISSQTGSYVGYSFAVPSNIAKKVVNDIMEYGNVQKAFMGISPAPVNTRDAIEKGINNIDGVYIERIEEESGADEAGLELGDIIKKVDQIDIHKYPDLTGYLGTKRPNDTINVTVERNQELLTLPVVLKERQLLVVPAMGMEVKNLTKDDQKRFRTKSGVKITGVPERYRGYGLEGKVIVQVDDKEIKNISDADTAFGAISRYGKTIITMVNEKGERERLIFQ
ncbi:MULTISPECIES: S1C family serine protease [Maribacter]|uniref:Trypsin-like peptidase domain-containing protein n=1 Tax=Maribacter flavus TaxID=1658664 RepID=A0ABU7IJT3_9FLAO|nr:MULTISPECIES: trypsin-like peptidase domain-containing protein [Maribacter]MDC6405994.1 trypsin-like peptidase domain-containing protein [Maribacter sp. PR66]MEE1973221.1 trypsin-like peptidase domain-containing protein [Maribacter flavus]